MFGAGSRRAQCSIAREWPREFMSSLPGNRSPGSRHSELASSVARVCALRVVASRASGGGVTSRQAAPSHLERVVLHRPESFSGTGMVRSPEPVIAICRVVWSRARCARSSRRKVTPSVDVVVEWGVGCFLSQSARLGHAFTRSTRTARRRRRARCGCRWST